MQETREEELARLIREQAADDTDYQRPQPGVIGYGTMADIIVDGRIEGVDRYDRGCPVHGRGTMVVDIHHPSGVRCKACSAEKRRLKRATSAKRREDEARWRANAKARRSA